MAQVKKRLVIMSEFADTQQNSTGFLVKTLSDALSKKFDVILIVPSERLSTWETKKRVAKLFKKAVILIELFFRAKRLGGRNSKILLISNPFLNWFVTRLFGNYNSIYFLIFDVFPETGRSLLRPRSFNFLQKLRNWSVSRRVNFICIGQDMADYISVQFPLNDCIDVRLWVNSSEIKQLASNVDMPVLLSFGNFGELTDFKIIENLSVTEQRSYTIKVVGRGAQQFSNHLNEMMDILIPNLVDFEKRSTIYEGVTACLVVQHPSLKGMAVPSKAFFSWENNKPIIYCGDKNSEIFRIISEYPFLGFAFEYDEVDHPDFGFKIDQVLCDIFSQPSTTQIKTWMRNNCATSLDKIVNFCLTNDN